MSTTLTNGLKLPDKGSVDWYADMQSNYAILDGAVGTIAEHTSALAGKAPLVHTHTKSDVTDLLNSNFIPSANNSYDLGSSEYNWNNVYCSAIYSPAIINSNNAASPSDSSVSSIVALRSIITYTSGDPDASARLNFRITGTGEKSFYPHETNQYSFGLASRQWSNSYIQHGYFTGTQQGDEYSGNTRTNLTLIANRDSVGVSGILVDSFRSNTTQGQAHHILGFEMKENSARYSGCRMHWSYDGNADKYNFSLCPTKQGTNQPVSFGLGETGYYWDSINNCNPGALSLPGNSSGINTDNWDKTGASINSYTPAVDGWLVLRCKDVAGDYLFATWSGGAMRASVTGQGLITLPTVGLCLYLPVKAGTTVDCVVKSTDKFGAYIYPCLGNV